jgi:thiamine biosynthesis lipoprotein
MAASRSEGIDAIDKVFEDVRRLDDLLSTWRGDSEIARLNQAPVGEAISLSPPLYTLLQDAARWSRLTNGAFDPAIGSLVDAWDLRGDGRFPDSTTLARARAAQGLRHFLFADETRSVRRTDSTAWLDTGGFGKGVAMREARRTLLRLGITAARLNFGGQVLVIGKGPSAGYWIVPVAHPQERSRPVAWLRFRDRSASTSSQSERSVRAAEGPIGHILDPRSGKPVPAWGSVTVVARDPAVADVVSTALLVLGPNTGYQWARERADVAVLFLVQQDGKLERRWNAALEKFLVTNPSSIGETQSGLDNHAADPRLGGDASLFGGGAGARHHRSSATPRAGRGDHPGAGRAKAGA